LSKRTGAEKLSAFALEYKDTPVWPILIYSRPADHSRQTATLWMYELAQDVEELEHRLEKC
jgi:hypothetical protein